MLLLLLSDHKTLSEPIEALFAVGGGRESIVQII
jgi:hypothetical protein